MLDTLFLKKLFKMHEEALLTISLKEEWKEKNPDKYDWEYSGKVASKAEVKRLGILIRQKLINIENKI